MSCNACLLHVSMQRTSFSKGGNGSPLIITSNSPHTCLIFVLHMMYLFSPSTCPSPICCLKSTQSMLLAFFRCTRMYQVPCSSIACLYQLCCSAKVTYITCIAEHKMATLQIAKDLSKDRITVPGSTCDPLVDQTERHLKKSTS